MTRFIGTAVLVRLILRRDRIRLPIWLLAILVLVATSVAGAQSVYGTPEAQATYALTVGGSAASIALSGPPVALDTIGGITVFEVSQVVIVGISLMVIFLTLRHTRTDEEAGRTEMLRAGVLGRNADAAAITVVMTAASVVVGVGVTASFVGAGLPVPGSVVYGVAVAVLGLVFTGIALVAAQVTEHARGGVGLAVAVLGALYLLRAAGDVGANWVTWTSPIGWVQAVRPFAGERWWPLALALLFAVGCIALAGWLTTRRDIGSGLVKPHPGPADASGLLAGPATLAARLQRGSVIGWSVGLAVLGAVFGSLGQDVEEMIEGNPQLAEVFARTSGGATVVDAYFATVLTMMALVATGFTVAGVLRLRSEESALRAEPLLATALSRTRLTAGWLAVVVLASLVVLGAGGLGAAVTYAVVDHDAGHIPILFGAMLAYLPAVLSLGALGFALFGWLPRSSALAWGALALCFVSGWLGPVLRLPEWLMNLSPYALTPQLPMEPFALGPVLGIGLVAAALAVIGLAGFRRRDLVAE